MYFYISTHQGDNVALIRAMCRAWDRNEYRPNVIATIADLADIRLNLKNHCYRWKPLNTEVELWLRLNVPPNTVIEEN